MQFYNTGYQQGLNFEHPTLPNTDKVLFSELTYVKSYFDKGYKVGLAQFKAKHNLSLWARLKAWFYEWS
jgi:hypothetical protein